MKPVLELSSYSRTRLFFGGQMDQTPEISVTPQGTAL